MLIKDRVEYLKAINTALHMQTNNNLHPSYRCGVFLTMESWRAIKEALQRDITHSEALLAAYGDYLAVEEKQLGFIMQGSRDWKPAPIIQQAYDRITAQQDIDADAPGYRKGLSHD
jgi:hypothetical protein